MEPFKNEFSHHKARQISASLKRAYPAFPARRFEAGLEQSLEPLELKQRMHWIADRIETCLPLDPPELFQILVDTLAKNEADTAGLRGFLVWPLSEIVARRGLCHFHESMLALSEMTRCFTAEFAIRPFLRQLPELTMAQLHAWCAHPDEHVRRLVSEGSRPLLPWGGNLPHLFDPPFPTLSLLEKIHRDPSAYVRLSVANHLNDLSKKNPAKVIETLTRWRTNTPNDPHLEKISRHACRTLLKAGDPQALDFHGFPSTQSLKLESALVLMTTVKLGGQLDYQIVVRNASPRPLRLMFDYAIHHCKANGTLSPKVFKGRVKELAAAETWEISGRHSFKPVTTRVYYPGIHVFEPRFNGCSYSMVEFQLER